MTKGIPSGVTIVGTIENIAVLSAPKCSHDDMHVGSDDVARLFGLGEGLDAIASTHIINMVNPNS